MFLRRVFILFVFLSSGCQQNISHPSTIASQPTVTPISTITSSITAVPTLVGMDFLAFTHQQTGGNRVVAGRGGLIEEPIEIQLSGRPIWLVAAPYEEGSIWVAALEDGRLEAYQIDEGIASPTQLNLTMLPVGMPPALQISQGDIRLLEPSPDASPNTNAVHMADGTSFYVNQQGQLRMVRIDETSTLLENVLPDARILSDDQGRLVLLTSPTDQYPHGVLGDMLEATAITLVDTSIEPIVTREIRIDPDDVIEGIAPIWVDLDGDGEREIIVTQSNSAKGARIVVYREDGGIFASGDPIGRGFRWRHQLAAAQFIPGGAQEIAVMRTPHIGGVLEVYVLEGDRLVVKGELGGYSSHQIGSRNLDSGVAGDFNGDGLIEIVVPDQSQTNLAGIQFMDDGLRAVWKAPIGAKLSTNLAAVNLSDGGILFGVGGEDNLLRIWSAK